MNYILNSTYWTNPKHFVIWRSSVIIVPRNVYSFTMTLAFPLPNVPGTKNAKIIQKAILVFMLDIHYGGLESSQEPVIVKFLSQPCWPNKFRYFRGGSIKHLNISWLLEMNQCSSIFEVYSSLCLFVCVPTNQYKDIRPEVNILVNVSKIPFYHF